MGSSSLLQLVRRVERGALRPVQFVLDQNGPSDLRLRLRRARLGLGGDPPAPLEQFRDS